MTIRPPNLPQAPKEWNARFQEEYSRVLRLFFNRIAQIGPLRGTTLTLVDMTLASRLLTPLGIADTTIDVENPDVFPTMGYGTVNQEKFYWNGKSGNTLLNVLRGQLATTAAVHAANDVIVPSAETGVIYAHPTTNALYRVF